MELFTVTDADIDIDTYYDAIWSWARLKACLMISDADIDAFVDAT